MMQGYRLMADEALDQWEGSRGSAPPTHVFIQGGVGGVAAAVSVQMRTRLSPALVPWRGRNRTGRRVCWRASRLGEPVAIGGEPDTIMAGLACGEPSLLAWQELERAASAFSPSGCGGGAAMRRLARLRVGSGESGAAGRRRTAGGRGDRRRERCSASAPRAGCSLFSTEGATDPAVYDRLVA